ncbi:zinc-dependent metalloprotease [Pedobacter sp. MC2016-24]|uniref:zinc-dependent metalloprotease n=1 Tax=Pedobacter sp. MC2016-24 TaxID=2780090 RepID=UPI00187E97FA|nr:zinc-dependent metalloprotease [Pedobacter sp. MC2016-24]MBE9601549.1 zinc-dependent metalloprotease [Pedobacter sp. MC2016-24]
MKFILYTLYFSFFCAVIQGKAADEPKAFDKFYKNSMKITPGVFPVYQDGDKYYLEISAALLRTDVLVVGDISKGYASAVAQSSGVIRFDKGNNNTLSVTRQNYKEAVSTDYNQEMESLVQKSNLFPVSFVVNIEAMGKIEGSYIIDMSKNLLENGDFFSFKDFNALARPDASRSKVQEVKAANNAVVFTVLRTQTDPGKQMNSGKTIDKASAFLLNLTFQKLSSQQMLLREADPRIGFSTIAFNDFGKSPYKVREVKAIKKWNLSVKPKDMSRYKKGKLVDPQVPITVYIDRITPAFFLPYIVNSVSAWNKVFESAGFKNVLQIGSDEQENWLSSGKIQVKWGNAYDKIVTSIIEDPRSGEIITAKMNVSNRIAEGLMPSYFVQAGMKDPRIVSNVNDLHVQGEILQWKVTQAFAGLFGMEPNFSGSSAYSTSVLRSSTSLKKQGMSSSITDDLPFNYVVQPEDQVPVVEMIPRIGEYDRLAIKWAYRIFESKNEEIKFLTNLSVADTAFRFLPEGKNDPLAQHGDLSSEPLKASALGLKNISKLYPQLEKITGMMRMPDEDWSVYASLSSEFLKTYENYVNQVVTLVGGRSKLPLIRGYNSIPSIYTVKAQQQEALQFLNQYLFSGVPVWMSDPQSSRLGNELIDVKFQRMGEKVLRQLMSPEVIGNLIREENTGSQTSFKVADLFSAIDHYVFKDFDVNKPYSNYSSVLQSNFVYNLAQIVAKNSIVSGLSEENVALHFYFMRVLKHINELSETHRDELTRERYKMMKMTIDREYLQKSTL